MATTRSDHLASLGAAIRAARQAAGLSQPEAARQLGVSTATVRGWEQGRREAPAAARLRMVEAWGANPASLGVGPRDRCPCCGRGY